MKEMIQISIDWSIKYLLNVMMIHLINLFKKFSHNTKEHYK